MNKVFVVVELYTFEFATDYRISIYSDKDKAIGDFQNKVAREKKDSWITTTPEDKLIETYTNENGKLEYNAYRDGEATEYETTILVMEKEVW